MQSPRTIPTILFALLVLFLPAVFAAAQSDDSSQTQSLEDLFNSLPADSGAGGSEASSPAGDQGTGSAASSQAVPGADSPWHLSGEQTADYHFPLFRNPPDYNGIYLRPRLENLLKLTGSFGRFSVISNWRATVWPVGTSVPGALPLAGTSSLTLWPEDNVISLGLDPFTFEVGYFVQPWGAADGLNPTDNINPVDYTRSLTPESIPTFLFRAVYFPAPSVGIEAVFEPYKQNDRFPVSVIEQIPAALFASSEIGVKDPPADPSSAVFGGRVSIYTAGADWSVSYLYDYDPYYTPFVTYTLPATKSLTLERTRIHRFGADVKTTAGPFGLWAEACYSLTTDPSMTSSAIRNPFLSWTVGGDLNYGPEGALYLNFQYSGRYVFGYYSDFYTDYPNGQPDPVKMGTDAAYAEQYYERALSQMLGDESEALLSTFALKADFPFAGGRWKPALQASYLLPAGYDTSQAVRYGSLLLEPSISFHPADPVTVTLGSELIFAWKRNAGSSSVTLDTSDRLGMFHDQSSVYLRAVYTW